MLVDGERHLIVEAHLRAHFSVNIRVSVNFFRKVKNAAHRKCSHDKPPSDENRIIQNVKVQTSSMTLCYLDLISTTCAGVWDIRKMPAMALATTNVYMFKISVLRKQFHSQNLLVTLRSQLLLNRLKQTMM